MCSGMSLLEQGRWTRGATAVPSSPSWKSLLWVCDGSGAGAQRLLGTAAAAAGGARRGSIGSGTGSSAAREGAARRGSPLPVRHFRRCAGAGGGRHGKPRAGEWRTNIISVREPPAGVLGGWSFVAFVEPKDTDFQDKKDTKLGKKKKVGVCRQRPLREKEERCDKQRLKYIKSTSRESKVGKNKHLTNYETLSFLRCGVLSVPLSEVC